ncbi:hypothetical protein PsyrH_25220 [Pseudomonas syringae pv. syringae HS191]|jgi:hypothetical protein|uniref:hypothetical protein n=1 Tax=Pseudomonas TaxID=286 RepID=UPI000624DC2C|nr:MULTISPECIES: hypothetical protein [Pseudomonas]AKF53741.1 hypothetical protein PsyrH_25220 [Pseudomonas syringae pv. syringae HS191]QNR44621.1 hypothetical protein D5S12_26560 [Pseudomonas syringae]SFW88407.1 hypothetical protein SAMN03159505_04839 [Pseudomonas sp. NFACC10-1]
MNYDEFFESVTRREISIVVLEKDVQKNYQLSNEALFQLPLISMIVLLLAKDRRKPIVTEIGQMVGESIEASLVGFKGSSNHLGWSAILRIRTVKAISFLERSGMIEIRKSDNRMLATTLGQKVIDRALSNDDDLSYNLSLIQRSYRNICVNKQMDLELV